MCMNVQTILHYFWFREREILLISRLYYFHMTLIHYILVYLSSLHILYNYVKR